MFLNSKSQGKFNQSGLILIVLEQNVGDSDQIIVINQLKVDLLAV